MSPRITARSGIWRDSRVRRSPSSGASPGIRRKTRVALGRRGGEQRAKKGFGIYWGRFNPPHEGHLKVIRRFASDWTVTVVVGSAERRNTSTDPFSGPERKRMLEEFLHERGIRGVRVVTLRDGPSESWAIDQLLKRWRPDVLFLSTEKTTLAALAEPRVRVVRFRRSGSISSTRIRDAIARGDPSWKDLTGSSVARLITKWHGLRRIREAYAREHFPRRRRQVLRAPRGAVGRGEEIESGPGRI